MAELPNGGTHFFLSPQEALVPLDGRNFTWAMRAYPRCRGSHFMNFADVPVQSWPGMTRTLTGHFGVWFYHPSRTGQRAQG